MLWPHPARRCRTSSQQVDSYSSDNYVILLSLTWFLSALFMVMLSNANWLRNPWLEWVLGLFIGLVTAALLVFTTSLFPGLEDYGVDFGLRLNVGLTSVGYTRLAIEPIGPDTNKPIHYVFLDVDPGDNGGRPDDSSYDSSDGACRALMKRGPRVKDLQCQPTRPLNRALLAEALKELDNTSEKLADSTGILAIVFDVALAEDSVINEEDKREDKELRDAMNTRKGKPPIIYAADAERLVRGDDAGVILLSKQEARYPGQARVAFPVADSAIRRYHRCFFESGSENRRESLPYSIARIVNSKLPECNHDKNPPGLAYDERIIYTLLGLDGHADSGPEIGEREDKQAFVYGDVYTHCLAAHLWTSASICSRPETYQKAIVVIGASNPFRRDQHYTPLGMMSGSEVVINATRSFLLYPDQEVKSWLEKLSKKAWLTFLCSVVWLGYYLIRHRMAIHGNTHRSVWARIRAWVAKPLMFLVTLAAVMALAIWLSFNTESSSPNLDVLLPVLAIGLEQYTEFSVWLLEIMKMRLARLFGRDRIHVEGNHP